MSNRLEIARMAFEDLTPAEQAGFIREHMEKTPATNTAEEQPLLFNAAGAAHLLSISKPTLHRWSRQGVVHPIMVAGQKRWPRADLEALVNGKGIAA